MYVILASASMLSIFTSSGRHYVEPLDRGVEEEQFTPERSCRSKRYRDRLSIVYFIFCLFLFFACMVSNTVLKSSRGSGGRYALAPYGGKEHAGKGRD